MEHKVQLAEIEAQAEQFPMEFFLQQQASHYSTYSHSSQLQSDDDDESMLSGEVDDLGNLIIVDNLPLVGPEKFEKLSSAVRKIFGRFGVIKEVLFEDIFFMPVDSITGQTLGYCFIEYDTPQEAELAKQNGNGLIMGKDGRYKLLVTLFNEFNRIMNVPDEWTPPEREPYVCGENLQKWLTDDKGQDQFLIRDGFDLEISWNDPIQLRPEVVHHLHERIEGYARWSPLGTYLATVNKQGVTLWGGATTFKCLAHCAHPEVKLIDFSAAEKYLVTYSCHEPETPLHEYSVVLNVFNVRTGKLKKSFKGSAKDFGICGDDEDISSVPWPLIRWSNDNDDKYFAFIVKNAIHVYEVQSYSFKKYLQIDDVKDFSWSPADPVIALFVSELKFGNQHARVSLVKIPGKEELRQKSLFNVSNCKMYWQSNGDYLAINVERYSKTKKTTYSALELFRMKEQDIPVEALELENENKNKKIYLFAWEPKGRRFAVLNGDNMRPDISFYSMVNAFDQGSVTKLSNLTGRQANALSWSPAGRFIVLAELSGSSGQLEFYDVDDIQTRTMTEHYMLTNIEWDSTGRYLATSVTAVDAIENGFNIWTFYGKLLYNMPMDDLSQFSWRPRPPLLLSAEKEEEIKKNLKKYSKKYKEEDWDGSKYYNVQEQQRRKVLTEEWSRWVLKWKWLQEEEKVERYMLRDEEASEEEEKYTVEEVECEEVLNTAIEMVAF